MERIFQAAQKDNIIIVPAAGDVDSIFELTTRAVFASMVFHCGVGKHDMFFFFLSRFAHRLFRCKHPTRSVYMEGWVAREPYQNKFLVWHRAIIINSPAISDFALVPS